MKQKLKGVTWAVWAGAFSLLILGSKTSLDGCRDGLELCIGSVIPALFPFLVLSPLFTQAMCSRSWKILKPLCRMLRIPEGCEAIVITGCLGGYPVGAQGIAQAYHRGQLRPKDALRMLGFCCNCGPGFIFGICSGCFSSPLAPWLLWLCHLAGAVAVGCALPGKHCSTVSIMQAKPIRLTDALSQAVRTMGSICGWVMIFRLILAFGEKYIFPQLGTQWAVLISGILELTNGCCRLTEIENESIRFVMCQGMLSFGGICVAMQSASVTQGLGMGNYLPGKTLQSIFSGLLAGVLCCAASKKSMWAAVLGGLFGEIWLLARFLLEKKQKMSGNPKLMGV